MNRIDRSWIESTFDLPDGREATVYIHPRAAVKITYAPAIDKAERLHAALWETINSYITAEIDDYEFHLGDSHDEEELQKAREHLNGYKQDLQNVIDKVIEEIKAPTEIKEKLITLRDELEKTANNARQNSEHWLSKNTHEGDRFSWQLAGAADAFALSAHHLHQLICKADL